ncbi:MAG: hypothetical protein K8S21_02800 [Gemmatimonadetes bacterium]|nr:hypothetical protein [Gemmatimonadota bacterium]
MRPFAIRLLHVVVLLATAPGLAAAQGARAATPRPLPVVVRDSRFDVLFLTRTSAAALDDSVRMSRYFGACRKVTVLRAEDSVAVIRSRLWDWGGSDGDDGDRLTLLVTRTSPNAVGCGTGDDLRATALARGFRVTTDVAYPYGTAITAVRVLRGSSSILPSGIERMPTSRITARGLLTIDGDMVRVSVPIDSLAPAADGRVSDMEIEITIADSSTAHRIRVPWTALQEAWEQMLSDRSARLTARTAAENRRLLDLLARPDQGAGRGLDARVAVGVNLSTAGDLAAARAVLGRAVHDEPCLTLGEGFPVAAREIVSAVRRPADRCRASMVRTLLQATVVPGLGQTRGTTRKAIGALVLGAVAGSLFAARSANADAKALHAEYLAVDGLDPAATARLAERLYDRAESRRLDGRRFVAVGAALWGASLAEATWTEFRLTRRLARVQDYRARVSTANVVPASGPGRVGVALTLF